jgi:hypothetical protein
VSELSSLLNELGHNQPYPTRYRHIQKKVEKMSRRKNRNKAPNLPSETLERARQQAETEVDESVEDSNRPAIVPDEIEILPPEEPKDRQAAARKRKRRRQQETPQAHLEQKVKSDQKYTAEEVAEMLENPTKFVTEDEMRQQYSYVLDDLRNMGILAAALLVALIAIAQFV